MIVIPAGEFMLGCPPDWETLYGPWILCKDSYVPNEPIVLSEFSIDSYEVSIGAYAECVTLGVCEEPSCKFNPDENPDLPAVCVSHTDASTFCNWAGKRLCTNAEWEKAARGTEGWVYPWGNSAHGCEGARLPICGCDKYDSAVSVCTETMDESPYGVFNMIGNVQEWVIDWYVPDYYDWQPSVDPPGPPDDDLHHYRIAKGDNFTSYGDYECVFSYARFVKRPDEEDEWTGFRCCL